MSIGYVRTDTENNIADEGIIVAADLDEEFDALETAFNNSAGHTHSGDVAEGAPITVVGPAQDFVAGVASFRAKTGSAYTLGTTSVRWTTGFLDNLVLTTALPLAQGGTGATSAGAARTALGVVIGTDVQAYSSVLAATTASYTTAEETKLSNVEAAADVTDTTNVTSAGALMDSEVTNLAAVKAFNPASYATAAQGVKADAAAPRASPTLTGVPAGPTAAVSTNTTQLATTAFVLANIPASPVKAWVNFNGSGVVAINGSLNVASITDNGTGDYTINFTTALASTSYGVTASGSLVGVALAAVAGVPSGGTKTVSAVRIVVDNGSGTKTDSDNMTVVVYL
jgi:hypothetical protein